MPDPDQLGDGRPVGLQIRRRDPVRPPPLAEEEPQRHAGRDGLTADGAERGTAYPHPETEDQQRIQGDLHQHRHHPQQGGNRIRPSVRTREEKPVARIAPARMITG